MPSEYELFRRDARRDAKRDDDDDDCRCRETTAEDIAEGIVLAPFALLGMLFAPTDYWDC